MYINGNEQENNKLIPYGLNHHNLNDGTFDQHNEEYQGGFSVMDDGLRVLLFGNTWQAFELLNLYSVTANTRLEFTYNIHEEAEGHLICADNDLNEETFGGSQIRCIAVGGTQFNSIHHVYKPTLQKAGLYTPQTVEVSIGEFFPAKGSFIKYIALIQDNDASPSVGWSEFRDLRLYDTNVSSF